MQDSQGAIPRVFLPLERPALQPGWYVEEIDGRRLGSHEGKLNGFTSSVTLVPGAGCGVALRANGGDVNGFLHAPRVELVRWLLGPAGGDELAQAVRGRLGRDAVELTARMQAARTLDGDAAALATLAGAYRGVGGQPDILVEARPGGLAITVGGMFGLELVPFEPGGFLVNTPPRTGGVVRFRPEDGGALAFEAGGEVLARQHP